ncbi:hypothetical protein ACJ6WD_38305 [Streptomyces sp. VTCC 41912]|uniref:hypothetical protein n=1 Tax=Streptomyces sp. VTCC 41912 TaxID=3383243 RepID=UPI0038968E0E
MQIETVEVHALSANHLLDPQDVANRNFNRLSVAWLNDMLGHQCPHCIIRRGLCRFRVAESGGADRQYVTGESVRKKCLPGFRTTIALKEVGVILLDEGVDERDLLVVEGNVDLYRRKLGHGQLPGRLVDAWSDAALL